MSLRPLVVDRQTVNCWALIKAVQTRTERSDRLPAQLDRRSSGRSWHEEMQRCLGMPMLSAREEDLMTNWVYRLPVAEPFLMSWSSRAFGLSEMTE